MNICLLNDSFPPVIDGVANTVMNYGRVLTNDLSQNVIVGTPRYPGGNYEGYPYKVVAYPSINISDFVSGYRAGNPLSIQGIAELTHFGPDIIHTHCPAVSTLMARILRNHTAAPIVFTYHTKFDVDIARAVGEGFLKKETIRTMVNNIEACDEVWVVSEGAGENLRSLGYEGEYRVMNNGVDFPKGRVDEATVKEVTKGFDLSEGVPMFLFVGRIMKYKGLPIILDAMSLLSEKGIDYRMVFVGGGGDEKEMQERVKELGIALDVADEEGTIASFPGRDGVSGKVIFTGPVHDRLILRAWNTRADLFLFPSVYDTNGIVVREAAACGLASVLIKDSCASEGITDGRNGYLIDENAQSMAQLLSEISGDLGKLHETGQNAMDEIYISWEDAVKVAYERYDDLLSMTKCGIIEHKKRIGIDSALKSTAMLMNETQKIFERGRSMQEGMRENFIEFFDDVEKDLGRVKDWINGNSQ